MVSRDGRFVGPMITSIGKTTQQMNRMLPALHSILTLSNLYNDMQPHILQNIWSMRRRICQTLQLKERPFSSLTFRRF